LLEKSTEHVAVAAGEGQQYNTIPAKQHLTMEFSLPENFASGRMPGRNGDAVFSEKADGIAIPFRYAHCKTLE